MAKIITTNDINQIKFYQIPKSFFHNPLYMDMKNESKIAYSILRDLLDLSIKNNWINENNEIYVKLSREKMMKRLSIKGTAKYAEVMKELIKKELIVKRTVGLNKVDETYVCIPEDLSVIYNDEELLEYEENNKKQPSKSVESRKFENQTSGSLKIKRQEVLKSNVKKFENQTHTKTNITKTNINSSSSSNNSYKNSLFEHFEANICELKKTTKLKFEKVIESHSIDFVTAVIDECATTDTKKYSGFESALQKYLDRDCKNAEDVVNAAMEFRVNRKKEIEAKRTYTKKQSNAKKSKFNNFEQRTYDFDKLEDKLRGIDKTGDLSDCMIEE